MTFCLKCKVKTDTSNTEVVTLKKGNCVVCNSKKSKLIKKQVTDGDIVSTLAPFMKNVKLPGQKYPGDMHYPNASLMGPFTRLDLRLNPDGTPKPDSLPINRVDEASYRHDLWYDKFKDTEHRNYADKLMVD